MRCKILQVLICTSKLEPYERDGNTWDNTNKSTRACVEDRYERVGYPDRSNIDGKIMQTMG